MRTQLKHALALCTLAATFTLASCQADQIQPQASLPVSTQATVAKSAPAKPQPVPVPGVKTMDDDQPPKSGNGGGGH